MKNQTEKQPVAETIGKSQEIVRMGAIHNFGNGGKTGGNNGGNNNNNNNGGGQGASISVGGMTNAGDDSSIVDDMLTDYNELAKAGKFSEALFRDAQIMQVLSILTTKKKPNALLVGDAGVGKTQIVEEIARRIVGNDPIVSVLLKNVNLYELSLTSVVSGASYVGQLEAKVREVLAFAEDPDNHAVLFIDEIHQLVSSSSETTYSKIAQQLKPAMGRGNIRVIGATTTQEVTNFMADPAFNRRWQEVHVPELTREQTAEVVLNIRDAFQNHHKVVLPDNLIEDAVLIGDEYKAYGSHRPDSTITLLDKAMSDARIKRVKLLEEVKKNPSLQPIITAQPRPVLNIAQLKQSAMTLLTGDENLYEQNGTKLEEMLTERIIGQEDARFAVTDAVKRLSLRLAKRNRPVSFLFAGPSGTGKTEIAKILADAMYGGTDRLIHLNLSEYSSHTSLTRITGSSAGYIGSESKRELPFDTLENNPYQVVLLDEIEKAHKDVQRFFMQAIDEGVVKTNRNKAIDFKRTIIIATTNAGAIEMNKRSMNFVQPDVPKRTNDEMIRMLQQDFDPELLNRFEKIVPFESITKEQYIEILGVKYNQIIKEAQDNRKDLLFIPAEVDTATALVSDKLHELADQSYAASSNGRPAERTIRSYIESTILDNPNMTQFDLL